MAAVGKVSRWIRYVHTSEVLQRPCIVACIYYCPAVVSIVARPSLKPFLAWFTDCPTNNSRLAKISSLPSLSRILASERASELLFADLFVVEAWKKRDGMVISK